MLFILLNFVSDEFLFVFISFISRIIQGLAVEIINILIFSLACTITENSEETSSSLRNMEIATTLGYISGPLITYFLLVLGYEAPFLFSILLDFTGIYLLKFQIVTKVTELNRLEDEEEVIQLTEMAPFHKISETTCIFKTEKKERSNSQIGICSSLDSASDNSNKHERKRKLSVTYISYSKQALDLDHYNLKWSENKMEDLSRGCEKKDNQELNRNVTIVSLLFNKAIFWTFLVVIADYTCQNFFQPVFTLVMKQHYGLSVENSSIILSSMYFAYFISLRFISSFLKVFPAKYLMTLGLLINSFCALLMNPVHIFPKSLAISISGYCLLNVFASFISISSLVDLTDSLNSLGYNEYISNDNASAVYILAINIAELSGPIAGGVLTNLYNYEFTTCVVGLLNLGVSALFLLVFIKPITENLYGKQNK